MAFALVAACSGGAASGDGASTLATEASTGTGDPSASTTTTTDASSSADGSSSGEPPPQPVPGLLADYYAGYHDLAASRIEPGIDAVWAMTAPVPELDADRFSIRWTGFLTAPASGSYTIATESDDGVRVTIAEELVIDDWTPHFVTRNEGSIDLVADMPVPIRVEYFEIDLDASMRLAWSSAALAEATIPESALTTIDQPSGLPGPKPPYINPVVAFDCPDPGVIALPDAPEPGYAMVCTGGTFPIRFSRDLVQWSDTGAALLRAGKPVWAANGFRNWAPEIHRIGDGFVAYYTTVDASDTLCIGAATAQDVLGPWVESPAPLVQHPLGVIDATWFHDGATPWLYYKIDGNSVGQPTPIYVRELAADGLSFQPGSVEIQVLVNDGATWEGGVVEAPWVVGHDGLVYLFYSGNVYDHRYRTGVARAPSATGPFEKRGAPILDNNERWVGPGHGSVVTVEGVDWFVYHAWTNAGDGTNDAPLGRNVLVDRIDWQDGWPVVHDGTPSRSLQPWPGE